MALARGEGVCQDQAHVFIAAAARRHAGALRQRLSVHGRCHRCRKPRVGRRLAGRRRRLAQHRRDALATGVHHCRLAVGRDYLDAAPVRGVRRAAAVR